MTLSLISFVWLLTVMSRRVTCFIMADSSSMLSEYQDGKYRNMVKSHLISGVLCYFYLFVVTQKWRHRMSERLAEDVRIVRVPIRLSPLTDRRSHTNVNKYSWIIF